MIPARITQIPNGCWVACLAGLTGIEHDTLAAVVPAVVSPESWPEYHNAVVRILQEHGWTYVTLGTLVPKGFAVAVGLSPRGVNHAVIVRDGQQWWDPHPDRLGLLGHVDTFEIVVPILPRAA